MFSVAPLIVENYSSLYVEMKVVLKRKGLQKHVDTSSDSAASTAMDSTRSQEVEQDSQNTEADLMRDTMRETQAGGLSKDKFRLCLHFNIYYHHM